MKKILQLFQIPEFLREGSAVKDFFNPPYTVIASESQKAVDVMKEVYKSIKAEDNYPGGWQCGTN